MWSRGQRDGGKGGGYVKGRGRGRAGKLRWMDEGESRPRRYGLGGRSTACKARQREGSYSPNEMLMLFLGTRPRRRHHDIFVQKGVMYTWTHLPLN